MIPISIKKLLRAHRYCKALSDIEKMYRKKKDPEILFVKARCLYYLLRAQEAVLLLKNLYQKYPRRARYGQLLARSLTIVGRYQEAFDLIRTLPKRVRLVLPLLGWHLIASGKFREGFQAMESERGQYWKVEYTLKLPIEKKLSSGISIKNKRLFIVGEAGLGDQMLFARFVEEYKKRGAYILCGVHSDLHSLFARLPIPPDELRKAETVTHSEYDYWVSTNAATTILTLERDDSYSNLTIPYFKSDIVYEKKWNHYFSKSNTSPRIALKWESKEHEVPNQFRSVPPDVLLRFADIGHLFSFQRDGGEEKILPHKNIIDLGPHLKNWEDTAAALFHIDYVVTSCTALAHLAGAMGKKTLVLTHMFPYFPWALPSEKTPWYPSVRVFRQPLYLDWEGSAQAAYKWIQEDLKKGSL